MGSDLNGLISIPPNYCYLNREHDELWNFRCHILRQTHPVAGVSVINEVIQFCVYIHIYYIDYLDVNGNEWDDASVYDLILFLGPLVGLPT